jgi:two-component system, sensor histidine kinase PdtaS
MDSNNIDTGIPGFSLDDLMEGYQLIDFNWRYIYVNKTVVKHSRCNSAQELIGYTMMEKYPGIENTRLFEILKDCMTERVSTVMENEFTFPDGSTGVFDLRIEPVPQGLFILSVDVTERKKKERERVKYISSLERMLEVTSNCVQEPADEMMSISKSLASHKIKPEELKVVASNIRNSAEKLNTCRVEIATMISANNK